MSTIAGEMTTTSTLYIKGQRQKWLIPKKLTVGLFVDLQKAFDTINQDILLISKLELYGIGDTPFNWLRSYLKERKQFVELGGFKAECLDIARGFPQGSMLGPKLFILHISDLCNVSHLLKFVLFADDTTIVVSGEKTQHILDTITVEVWLYLRI